MLLIRLFIVFVLICFTNSSNTELIDESQIVQYNKIIESIGWKSLSGIYSCDSHGIYKLWNKNLAPLPFKRDRDWFFCGVKKHRASVVLTLIYGDMLTKLHQFYRNMIEEYINLEIYENKLNYLQKLIQSFSMFKPLLTCMVEALDYFEIKYKNVVLHNLIKSLSLIKWTTDIKFKNRGHTFNNRLLDDIIRKINGIVKSNKIHRLENIKVEHSEPFVVDYIEELRNLNSEKQFLDPEHPEFQTKVEAGVNLFCKNFGFTQNVI